MNQKTKLTDTQKLEETFQEILCLLHEEDALIPLIQINSDSTAAFKIMLRLKDEIFEDGGNDLILSQSTEVLKHLVEDIQNEMNNQAMYGLLVASELTERLHGKDAKTYQHISCTTKEVK